MWLMKSETRVERGDVRVIKSWVLDQMRHDTDAFEIVFDAIADVYICRTYRRKSDVLP